MRNITFLILLFLLVTPYALRAEEDSDLDLELLEQEDAKVLTSENLEEESEKLKLSEIEETDDLESLKNDIGELVFDEEEAVVTDKKEDQKEVKKEKIQVFDIGKEEGDLLEIAKLIQNRIPDVEWSEISKNLETDVYEVQEGDWLWKIAKTLFGSGFYYAKIWSLNPHITNPHEIEPGMKLVFNFGNEDAPPKVSVATFTDENVIRDTLTGKDIKMDFSKFGDAEPPNWVGERQGLINQGVYFQYASEETYDDLAQVNKKILNKEYEKYEVPYNEILISEPGNEYDSTGFDKNSKIQFDYKEGFFLNTFISTNVVQDLGYIKRGIKEGVFIHRLDQVYVEFNSSLKVKPGDRFSVYSPEGEVAHSVSDRSGFRYSVTAQIKVVKRLDNSLWECQVTDISGVIQRGSRITVYTPRISKIIKTFSQRNVEAAIIDSYRDTAGGLSYGDVIYLDRGRADGVEMGTVFEVYSFTDRGTGKKISNDPSYKIGELTVITLTDDFSTALITLSSNEMQKGNLAFSKSKEMALRASAVKKGTLFNEVKIIEDKSLEELDVELNMDDFNEDLLEKADKIRLTEDELEELERQEKEKSILKEHERDLRELERLEKEIEDAESEVNSKKLDEDKYLEQENLDALEKKTKTPNADAFTSLNEIESEVGRKYIDGDLNNKENPYGLTEFDLEEIDELLNTEVKE